ncbi:MAG: Na(+)/H(+) antiporter subunit D [Pseudomonadota bacterium]|nr:Na(+)/H(+) antiporter subunit D [Pseudomonadota bacterium]
MSELHPALPFFVAAVLAALLRGMPRAVVMLAVPLLGAYNLWAMGPGVVLPVSFLDYDLVPLRIDDLSILFGYLFHLAAFIAVVFALHVKDSLQHTAALTYVGGALGAVFAGDLLTLFVFWEIMAVSSAFLIYARRTARAYSAAMRYFIIHVLSGVLLLAGALFTLRGTGSLAFNELGLAGPAGWLIFIAFGIKCAFPFLHNWLTDAYPEGTPTSTVFLSAFTTKVAVYALARGFPGTELLIYVGAAMTCFPIFYAVIENDLRRVLAYSMINQIGFMVVGVGIGTALSINGAVAHAVNDVIFKGLLLMAMGAVLYRTGRINGSDLGGLYKTMPKTTVLCIVGAASISAFPLFSGFVSKSMVMTAALKEGYDWVWLCLLFASAGVFHHAGIKIPYFAFFAHDSGIRASEPPLNMLLAMCIAAVLCIAIGCFPQALYSLLPFGVDYSAYDTTHVLAQLQLLFFSALAFVWLNLRGLYPPELRSVNIDVEWLYRKLLPAAVRDALGVLAPVYRGFINGLRALLTALTKPLVDHHGPQGVLARAWPIGSMVLWVAVLLGFYLIFL